MKLISVVICLLFSAALMAQKSTLEDILWKEAGGRSSNMDADKASRTTITDDAANGYLRVYYEGQGCGCPFETTVAGYKEGGGGYTVLKTYWDGCGDQKTMSANKALVSILPKDFGLHTFLPDSSKKEYTISDAVFYLDVKLPRKGTDTALDLAFIPFGIYMRPDDKVLAYAYNRLDSGENSNFGLEELMFKIQDISHENTLECILERSVDAIIPEDKKIVEKIYGEGKFLKSIDELAAQIQLLKTIYEISNHIEYRTVILGWDRDKARFFVKEKIKNDVPEMSFLEFVKKLPFLKAVC